MALSIGTRLGRCEILPPSGPVAWREVYRARDTKPSRDVAIKVLPESFAHDAERLGRFTREAQTFASLNHPNIAVIYGIEARVQIEDLLAGAPDGADAIVMAAASPRWRRPLPWVVGARGVYRSARGADPIVTGLLYVRALDRFEAVPLRGSDGTLRR